MEAVTSLADRLQATLTSDVTSDKSIFDLRGDFLSSCAPPYNLSTASSWLASPKGGLRLLIAGKTRLCCGAALLHLAAVPIQSHESFDRKAGNEVRIELGEETLERVLRAMEHCLKKLCVIDSVPAPGAAPLSEPNQPDAKDVKEKEDGGKRKAVTDGKSWANVEKILLQATVRH